MGLKIRRFQGSDIYGVLEIATLAWTPIFASFRQILGEDIFPIVYPDWTAEQSRGIEAACNGDGGQRAWVAESDGEIAGFIVYRLDEKSKMGEIGYNAVHPDYQNRGIATHMYQFVLGKMKEGGMRAAHVGTGGDASHVPARRAYEKAGFVPLPLVRYYIGL